MVGDVKEFSPAFTISLQEANGDMELILFVIFYISIFSFESRDAVADKLQEDGASLEIVNKVRREGKKYW